MQNSPQAEVPGGTTQSPPIGEAVVPQPQSDEQAQKPKNKVETDLDREAREREEKLRKDLIPDLDNLRPINFGISLADGNRKRSEPIDMGGRYNLEEALQGRLEFGEQIDVDWELYERISGPLEYFYTKRVEAQAAGKADFEEIADLSPNAQAALADYEVWRNKAKQIQELRKSDDKKNKEIGRQARVFGSGLEYQRALVFLEQTEIIATHAVGYELTNGGREALSFRLSRHQIDFPEKANMPGELRQAIHQIAQACHISDPVERASIIGSSLIAAGAGLEAGIIVSALTGNPLVGAAVGAGTVITVVGGEVLIGNWILSFPQAAPGEGVAFTLRYRANQPANSPQARIVDSPMGRHFSGRGEPHHTYTSDFIVKSEKTRHAIYRRLGLRVENYGTFDWNNITSAQERFIRRLGIKRPLIRGWNALDAETKSYIKDQGSGRDLWMIDLNPTNLSISGTDTASFHGRVRGHIQNILNERDRNLPTQALSSGEIYYNFSQLSADERHEIMVEAYNRMAADICSTAGGNVLQRIILRGEMSEEDRKLALEQLASDATAIKTGTKVIEVSEITDEVIQTEQRRRAQAKDKITRLNAEHSKITTIDTEITTQEDTLVRVTTELSQAQTEQGSRSIGAGVIGEHEAAINIAINEVFNKLTTLNIASLGIALPPDRNRTSVEDVFLTLQRTKKDLENQYKVLNPQEAQSSMSLILARAPQTDVSGYRTRIQEGEEKSENISIIEEAINRINTCRTTISEKEAAIVAAETIVDQKQKEVNTIDTKLQSLRNKRRDAVETIRNITHFEGEYGEELFNIFLSQTNAEITKIEKELKGKGIPFEAGEEVKIVSEVDKMRAEGMEVNHTVGTNLSTIVSNMWKEYDAAGLSDPKRCKEVLLRIICGKEALSPDKRAFYERLLSNTTVVEELFNTVHLDGRETQFFYGDNEGRMAYDSSRRNLVTIVTLSAQIQELKNNQETGWENQVKILEERLHHFQDENVRLLNGLFDKYVPAFLGHSRLTDVEFVRKLVDRMIINANDFQPFTDTVQYGEKLVPHLGPDGTVSIRPPDINPTDDSLINRGAITWNSPDDYKVAGQSVRLKIEVPISRTGRPLVNVEFHVQNLRALHSILPPTRAQLDPNSPITAELNRLGLLNQLYDAAGNKISSRTNVFRALADNEDNNKQVRDTIWQISARGIPNANSLEAWLQGGANYNFGGRETNRFYRSIARSFAKSTPEANADIIRKFDSVDHGNYTIRNERGELRLYRYDAAHANVESTISLHDLLYTVDDTQRRRIISIRDLNGILYEVGKNLFESTRLRKA